MATSVSYDYMVSAQIAADDWPVNALLMAAMRKADATNLARLREAFPDVWDELRANEGLAKGGS